MRFLLHVLALAVLGPLASCGPQSPEADQRVGVRTATAAPTGQVAVADTVFASRVARLSEPGGYFDTDNLISNESSYLHVIGAMERLGVTGGAYIGVGPDQNFSYVASIRPRVAFILDIRRDNLLQQLMFRALFIDSRNRLEYLCRLVGRPCPDDLEAWNESPVGELVDYIDGQGFDPDYVEAVRSRMDVTIDSFGLRLSGQDLSTIERFHRTFIDPGLDLRFQTFGRPPRWFYPTLRQLLLETDLDGRQSSYLASEDDFRYLKELEEAGLVIPVVGDLAGNHALREIGALVSELGERVSAIYTSNVEFYLFRAGSFARFADNVATLPIADPGVIIRSYFGGGFRSAHPQTEPGYYSTQLLQTLQSLVAEHRDGGYRSYQELVTLHSLDLHP